MIVDEYAEIARRMAQLRQRQQPFQTPDGVHIILSSKYSQQHLNPVPAGCKLCLWLDEDINKLLVLPEASREKAFDSAYGKEFVRYLTEHCPSVQSKSPFELQLSADDTRHLARQLGRERE